MYGETHVYIERDMDQLMYELSHTPDAKLVVDSKYTPGTMYLNTYTKLIHMHPEDYRWLATARSADWGFAIDALLRTRHEGSR